MRRAQEAEDDPEKSVTMMDTEEEPREPHDGGAFLDSFYGISSPNPVERAKAGQILLYHAVLGPDANAKDAAYAFRRLLSGLCSGRASARQGNAAVLASFLKFHNHDDGDKWSGIRDELSSNDDADEQQASSMTDLQFVRHRLCKATEVEATGSRGRKGSEERDYQFGRLFGINSIVRSGILLKFSEDEGTIVELARDLANLYHQKRWLREPSAHAICMLLHSFVGEESAVVEAIISKVIVPELLAKGDVENRGSALACYSAEQLALALFLQSRCSNEIVLPPPLDVPILSRASLPEIALALSETSVVVQPRIHLVWDVIWMYVSKDPTHKHPRKIQVRVMKEESDGISTEELLQSLLKHVVYERLLRFDESTGQTKTTHERRALAMSIVRSLAGIEFVSALQGRTRLVLEPSVLCNLVFNPIMVQKIFLEVICAGSGRQKNAHMLKPMALQILSELTNTFTDSEVDMSKTKFAVARALLTCDPKFDQRTKTNTVEDLLKVEDAKDEASASLWEDHISFLRSQITANTESIETPAGELQISRTLGFLENLFHLAKHFSRLLSSEDETAAYILTVFNDIVSYFMGIAFFDCTEVKKSPKKKKKSDKLSSLREIVAQINGGAPDHPFSFEVRSTASARFFSLVTDRVAAVSHSGKGKEASAFSFLQSIWGIHEGFISLGAKPLGNPEADEMDEEDGITTTETIAQIMKLGPSSTSADVESHWLSSCKMLASVLRLLLLSCGGSTDESAGGADVDADDEAEDREEISELMSDILQLMKVFSAGKPSSDDEDPLRMLSMVCCTSLTSAFGTGNKSRGASPTLLRESVKMLWTNGLSFAASKKFVLDDTCVSLLLDALGIVSAEDSMDIDDDESGESESDEKENASVKEEGDESMGLDEEEEEEEEEDEDIEVDETRLQTMLEEDSDIDVDEHVLEHHEGADAALAKLIQTKQEARKAGQVARERSILAQQTRIITLFECLVVGKPETWGNLLNYQVVLRISTALLSYRNMLSKSLEKSPRSIIGEKRSFAGRLTVLLKTKILKSKIDGLSKEEFEANAFLPIKDELLKSIRTAVDKEQRQICFHVLLFAVKNLADADNQLEAADDLFGKLASDWASNRSSKLESIDFENCIHHSPILAQATLAPALAKASSSARSSFLKAEAFRLLGLLYNPKLNANETPAEKQALERIGGAAATFFATVQTSLESEPDMKKTKRLREVLRVVEKGIAFLMHYETAGYHKKVLDSIAAVLQGLDSESQAVTDAATKICGLIESIVPMKEKVEEEDSSFQKVKKSSKKKKKKSKR